MNVFDLAQQDTQLKKVSWKEYAGPCPGCHGTDRFHVQPDRREGGAWMCRNCSPAEEKGWGDNKAYLMHFRGMPFPQAKSFLEGNETTPPHRTTPPTTPKFSTPDWQRKVSTFVEQAHERLRTDEGQAALDYLHSRGLTDETIRKSKLGYAVWITDYSTKTSVPCIVIPWNADGQYWRVTMRDIRPGIPRDKRYRNYPGSSVKEGLYGGDALKLKRPTFLVEGELDALSIAQEAGSLVAVVATGTTDGSRTPRWKSRLARVPHVFVAFDREEKGDTASEYWLTALPNSTRWRPLAHDANDMLRTGGDILQWVTSALTPVGPTTPHTTSYTLDMHVARLREARRRAEPTSVEQAIMHQLHSYNVQFRDHPCSCGCHLFWYPLGDVACARCEPGALWSETSLSMLAQVGTGDELLVPA